MATPDISVIMPVYNGASYISSAIDSLLAQTYQDWELIVVDDGSTDESAARVKAYSDPRIRLVSHRSNRGLPQARNTGIREARGTLIAFLDSDDQAAPNRLTVQRKFLADHPQIGFIGSWVQVIDERGTVYGNTWKHATAADIIPVILLFRNCFTQSSMMLRADCFHTYKFRDVTGPSPDFDLWTRLVADYRCANIPQVLGYYRVTETAMSVRDEAVIESGVKKIHEASLRRLGLKPNPRQITIHDGLERWRDSYDTNTLAEVEQWLLLLLAGNEQSRFYPADLFRQVISDYWVKVCSLNADKGKETETIYFRSPIAQLEESNRKKKAVVRILCRLHKKRLIDVTSQDWIRLFH